MKATTTLESKTELVRTANRMPRWVLPLVRLGIFLLDAGLAKVCFIAAFLLRAEGPLFAAANGSGWSISPEFAPYFAVMCFAVPIRVLMLLYQQVYRLSGAFTYTEEAIKIFKAVSVGSLLAVSAAFLFRGGFLYREFSYSRGYFCWTLRWRWLFSLPSISAYVISRRSCGGAISISFRRWSWARAKTRKIVSVNYARGPISATA